MITDVDALKKFVDECIDENAIALDIEAFCIPGRALGRVSLLQFATELDDVYIVDALRFKRDELRSALSPLLESATPVKLMYDCRVDAHALHSQLGIRLRGAFDLQLLGTYLRVASDIDDIYRTGLKDALKKHFGVSSPDAVDIKAAMKSGSPVWDERPLTPAMVQYAAGDVRHLHNLRTMLKVQAPRYCMAATRRLTERFVESYTTTRLARLNQPGFDSFIRVRESWLEACMDEARELEDSDESEGL